MTKPRRFPLKRKIVCPFDNNFCAYPCFKLVHGRMDAGLTDNEAAARLGVSRSTWWRYRGGQQRPPLSVCGFLSCLAGVFPWRQGWERFSLNVLNGKLFRNDLRDGFTPGDVAAIFWMRQELEYWRSAARDPHLRDVA